MTLSSSTITKKTFKLVCQKIQKETHDVKTFIFSIPHAETPVDFSYHAGQHLNFMINMAGTMQTLYFTNSGDQYMVVEMQSQENLYELNGDKLTINGGATINFTWSVNEDRLILTPTDNTEPLKYIRLK